MDPELEQYLDKLESAWLRNGESRDVVASRRARALREIDEERERLLIRGITEDVTRKAILWHKARHPRINLRGSREARSTVLLEPLASSEADVASRNRLGPAGGSHFGFLRQSPSRSTAAGSAGAGREIGTIRMFPDGPVVPLPLLPGWEWLRHREGIGNIAGILFAIAQEGNPAAPLEGLSEAIATEARGELRDPRGGGAFLARELWGAVTELGRAMVELAKLQLTHPRLGRQIIAEIVAEPFVSILNDVTEGWNAAQRGDQFECSRRLIVATAKVMRLIVLIDSLVASVRSLPATTERVLERLRQAGQRLEARFQVLRRRYFPRLAEMTPGEYAAWLERQRGEVNLGAFRPRRGPGNAQAIDDAARGLETSPTERTPNAGGSAPAANVIPIEPARGPGTGPAAVIWVDARGRTTPSPRRARGRFSIARLLRHGDRVTWLPEEEGGAIVEATMRYEPTQLTARSGIHEPTSRARAQTRAAREATGNTVQYDAGHLRPAILDGIAEAITSFPQSSPINRGQWARVEERIVRVMRSMREASAQGLIEDPGIVVNFKFRYSRIGAQAPDEFVFSVRFGGRTYARLRIANNPRLGFTVEDWNPATHDPGLYGKEGIERLRRAAPASNRGTTPGARASR